MKCDNCKHASEKFERKGAMQRRCNHPKAIERAFANTDHVIKQPLCPIFEAHPDWCPLLPSNREET